MAIPFEVLLDTEKDYDFDTDISAYVTFFHAFVGSRMPDERLATHNRLEMTLDNRDAVFGPESASYSDALFVGVAVMIQSASGSHFLGYVTEYRFDFNSVYVVALGRLAFLDGNVVFPIMQNVRADEIIDYVLDRAWLPWPRADSTNGPHWQLNQSYLGGTGAMETNQTVLGSFVLDSEVVLGTGVSTFDYVGNHYTQPTALQILRDAVTAEWGFLVEYQNGVIVFHNRHYRISLTSTDFTVTAVREFAYGVGPIFNEITVRISPVYFDLAATLWTNQAILRFSKSLPRKRFQFRDPTGRALGVLGEVTDPGLVFYDSDQLNKVAKRQPLYETIPDGSGFWIDVGFSTKDEDVLYVPDGGQTVVGDAVVEADPVTIVWRNEDSIVQRGRQSLPIDLPNFADLELAEDLAYWVGGQFDAIPIFQWVDVDPAFYATVSLGNVIRLNIAEPFNHDVRYLVIGREVWFEAGVSRLRFYLEQVSQRGYWILNRSTLGNNTRLAL